MNQAGIKALIALSTVAVFALAAGRPGVAVAACALPSPYEIYFESGGSALTSSAATTADGIVAKFLAVCPSSKILVTGHSDGAEATGANPAISLQRAHAIRAYLVAHGIGAAVISVEDKGFTAPARETAPNVGEPQNRSVDVTIN